AIVQHRRENGLFTSRAGLLDVARFSSKSFEQAAGFLRVPGAPHPLDNTGVHPERYAILEALAARLGKPLAELLGPGAELVRQAAELREEVGSFTFDDIVRELEKPGRDPRDSFVPFSFRDDVHELQDLKPGMVCPGLVTNVTNFGAFVDVGVHQDGLVHISQMGERFVKDPRQALAPGDRVSVRVLKVDLGKKQISLTMKTEPPERRARRPAGRKASPAAKGGEAPPRQPRAPARRPPPRPAAARPPGASASPPSPPPSRPASPPSGRGSGDRPRGPRREAPERRGPSVPRAPAPAFNNPFAVLASLKDDGKKKS
ncbi:MAG TPA: S1 RNA-binding domain-containing protein, partial [Vicinamibacteria bacterium]|nr:S1 RNA-binding domain-containing protein [Vicinamibacteria bacterium]